MASETTLEVPVKGMDCAECVAHVQYAIAQLPGMASVQVFLSSEKAVLRFDSTRVSINDVRAAVAGAGYSVPESVETAQAVAKIERDHEDGRSLGVTGTPTFFINGQRVIQANADVIIAMIDEALVASESD